MNILFKKILKRLLQILFVIFSIFVLVIVVIVSSSNVREWLLNLAAGQLEESIEISNITSSSLSKYQIAKIENEQLNLVNVNLEVDVFQLLSKRLFVENLEVESLFLKPSQESTSEFEWPDLSYLNDIQLPVDVYLNKILVKKAVIGNNQFSMNGSAMIEDYTNSVGFDFRIEDYLEDKNFINVTFKDNSQLTIDSNWAKFSKYENAQLNSIIDVRLVNDELKLNVSQFALDFKTYNKPISLKISGNTSVNLDLEKSKTIDFDVWLNDALMQVDLKSQGESIDGKISLDSVDLILVKSFLADSINLEKINGLINGELNVSGLINQPKIDGLMNFDGELEGGLDTAGLTEKQKISIQLNAQTNGWVSEFLLSVKSKFLQADIQSQLDFNLNQAEAVLRVEKLDQNILNLFDLENEIWKQNLQFELDGEYQLNAVSDNSLFDVDSLKYNWQSQTEVEIKENKQSLNAQLNIAGENELIFINQVLLKTQGNQLFSKGTYSNKTVDLDVSVMIKDLYQIPYFKQIKDEVAFQKVLGIDGYLSDIDQWVYELDRLLHARFSSKFSIKLNDSLSELNQFDIKIEDDKGLEFEFVSDKIDLRQWVSKKSSASLKLGNSELHSKGKLNIDGENDLIVKVEQLDSNDLNPILEFYDVEDYAVLDFLAAGDVELKGLFSDLNWALESKVHLTKNENDALVDIDAKGDYYNVYFNSVSIENGLSQINVTGSYEIDEEDLKVDVVAKIDDAFSLPWVQEVWLDDDLQKKWLLHENIQLYKENVVEPKKVLQSNINAQFNLWYNQQEMQIENLIADFSGYILNEDLKADAEIGFMDINLFDFKQMDILLKTNNSKINIKGLASEFSTNDFIVEFEGVKSSFVFDALAHYQVEAIKGLDFDLGGKIELNGLLQSPRVKIISEGSLSYEDVEIDANVMFESSSNIENPIASIQLSALGEAKNHPLKLEFYANVNDQILNVDQLILDGGDIGSLNLKGSYKHDLINGDVFSGLIDANYQLNLDSQKIHEVIVDALDRPSLFYSVEGAMQSKGEFKGSLNEFHAKITSNVDVNVVQQLGGISQNLKLNHQVLTNNDKINQVIKIGINKVNSLQVNVTHENDFESILQDPINTNWDGQLSIDAKFNSLVNLIPDFDQLIFGDLDVNLQGGHRIDEDSQSEYYSSGYAKIINGRYINEDLGLSINRFIFDSKLENQKFNLNMSAKDDARGEIKSNVSLLLSKNLIDSINAKIEFLDTQLIERTDLDSQISGNIFIKGDINKLLVSGDLIAKNTQIYLDRMQLIGVPQIQVTEVDTQKIELESEYFNDILLNINVKTDDKTKVSGRGVKMNLDGVAYIKGNLNDPNIFAQLNLKEGRFDLFSRVFEIEQGLVRMENDDVFVDLQSVHRRSGVDYFARISGIEGRYDIELRSVPAFDQDQLISQLMFGQSVEKINAFQAIRLAQAVSYLNNNGARYDILKTTQEILDVDNIDIQNIDGVVQLLVGKYINENIYIELGTSRSSDQSNVNGLINIELNENLELSTYSGTNDENTGVELQWKNDY